MKKSPVSNFLLLFAGIVMLFMACVPDFTTFFTSVMRAIMRLAGFGNLGLLLILSKAFLILGGGALAALGLVNNIIDAKKTGRQPNWVVVGCVGGSVLFAFLSLIDVLFWIGIFACPALVVALIMAYKESGNVARHPLTKPAAMLLACLIAAFIDRWFNVMGNTANMNILCALIGIAAFVGIIVLHGKLKPLFDANGQIALQLMMIGSILYAVAEFFNLLAAIVIFIGYVAWPLAIAGWVLFLIAAIKMMNSKSLGDAAHKGGLFMMIGLLVSILSSLPLINLGALGLVAYGWYLITMGIEEQA